MGRSDALLQHRGPDAGGAGARASASPSCLRSRRAVPIPCRGPAASLVGGMPLAARGTPDSAAPPALLALLAAAAVVDLASGSASGGRSGRTKGYWINVHGILMAVAWALLLPLGSLLPAHRCEAAAPQRTC